MTSSEMNFLTAPENSTTARNDPFEMVRYGVPRPVGVEGLGTMFSAGQIAGGAAQGAMAGGPIGAAVGAAVGVISGLFTPNVSAQDATTLVNGIEPILKANLASFKANPTPANQVQGETVFLSYWNALVSGCAQYGGAGTACVNDRSPGGKWDWWAYYYYPIANYNFATATQTTTPGTTSVANTAASNPTGAPTTVSGTQIVANALPFSANEIIFGGLAILALLFFTDSHHERWAG